MNKKNNNGTNEVFKLRHKQFKILINTIKKFYNKKFKIKKKKVSIGQYIFKSTMEYGLTQINNWEGGQLLFW